MKTVKSLIIVFVVAMVCNKVIGQNNLQFNAAKYIQLSGNNHTGIVDSVTINVPSGKVWKIESAAANLTNPTSAFNGSEAGVTLNGVLISGSSLFPIWLPSGSYLITLVSVTTSAVGCYVSAIEFNLVQ